MRTTKVDVVVLGAGIIGVSFALELQKSGRQVMLIDRGEPGFGCSYGNAGWITPCFAMPLPQPGMFWKSLGWLLDPESPLHIKPELSWALARWMLGFMAAMNTKRMHESVAVLADISKYSLNFYRELAARTPQNFGFDQKGLLMVSANDDGLKAAELEMKLMSERGIEGRLLNGEQVRALEPALKPLIQGGVYFPTEAHAEPLATVKAMIKEFEAAGGVVQSRTEVYDFEFEGNRISRILTTRGDYSPELVAYTLGSWSVALAKRLRVSLPILGGKGYSLIVEDQDVEVKPQHPIMIIERKIAVTPRADSVRFAGTLELVNQDERLNPRRMRAILKGAQEYMYVKPEPRLREIWRGLRPCTPDGVPIIGYSKRWDNLFYNVGHQMLGLQSAPGSAKLATDLVYRRASFTDSRPFRPERYE